LVSAILGKEVRRKLNATRYQRGKTEDPSSGEDGMLDDEEKGSAVKGTKRFTLLRENKSETLQQGLREKITWFKSIDLG